MKPYLAGSAMLFALALSTGAQAAASKDENWPCIQRKIPNLSLGMIWSGPAPDTIPAEWRGDTAVRQLGNRIAARRTDIDKVAELVEKFSQDVEPAQHNLKLTQLMVVAFDRINGERRSIMSGIERFTKKQRQLADEVRKTRKELSQVLAVENPDANDDQKRKDLEKKLVWQTRIHDDREQSLTYVCESPVLLEQRAFAIAREIANHLKE